MLQRDEFRHIPIDNVMKLIGQRLNLWRISRKIRTTELAMEMGVSRATVERLLAGKGSSMETLLRALLALDLSPNIDLLIPDVSRSPMALLNSPKALAQRKRVRKNGSLENEPWTWAEDE